MKAGEVEGMKEATRRVWSVGDYDAVAQYLWGVGEIVVQRASIGEHDVVLDIGAGTGNIALRAAERKARVTACDLTPAMVEIGREKSQAAGYEIEWMVADAEELPFRDIAFDAVVSSFGQMFAPRQRRVAQEIERVLRPGGRLCLANWRPDGNIGAFFGTIGSHLPSPPDPPPPPALWGDPDHVRKLFNGTRIELGFEIDTVDFIFDSPQAAVEMYTEKFGPLLQARAALEPDGKWEPLVGDLTRLFEERSRPLEDGRICFPGEYLIVLGRKG